MSKTETDTITVTIERDIAYPPEKVWRALTEPQLIEQWLMKNNFQLAVGHRFTMGGDWGSVDCQVKTIDPNKTLQYTWDAMGLESVVTFTLAPTSTGTHLRVEQSGFRPEMKQAIGGAKAGWKAFLGNMDQVLARLT